MKALLKSLGWRGAVFAGFLALMVGGVSYFDFTGYQLLWVLTMHWFGIFLGRGRHPVLEASITVGVNHDERS